MLLKDIAIFGQNMPLDMMKIVSYGYFDGELPIDTIITDHTGRAVDLILDQFQNDDDLKLFIAAMTDPLQEVEYVLSQLFTAFDLDTAVDDALDIVGAIVGQPRNFLTNEEYRLAIKLKIFINCSNGEPETIIAVARYLTKAKRIYYIPLYPAKARLEIKTMFPIPKNLIQFLESIAPAGVEILVYLSGDDDDFAFAGEGGLPPADNTQGFSEKGFSSIGGRMVEHIH